MIINFIIVVVIMSFVNTYFFLAIFIAIVLGLALYKLEWYIIQNNYFRKKKVVIKKKENIWTRDEK